MSAADQFDQHTDIVGIVRLVALGTVPIPILSAFLVGGPILTVAISGLLFRGHRLCGAGCQAFAAQPADCTVPDRPVHRADCRFRGSSLAT